MSHPTCLNPGFALVSGYQETFPEAPFYTNRIKQYASFCHQTKLKWFVSAHRLLMALLVIPSRVVYVYILEQHLRYTQYIYCHNDQVVRGSYRDLLCTLGAHHILGFLGAECA